MIIDLVICYFLILHRKIQREHLHPKFFYFTIRLVYIFLTDSNWEKVSKRLKLKSLKATVIQYQESGVEALKGKKKDETAMKTQKICQVSV